ncbi:MAG: tail fiber domain-containing protein [Bacteroidota bacterium]
MKKISFIILVLTLHYHCSIGQNVGIGTNDPDASAALEIKATAKGLLIPRTSTTTRIAFTSPAKGLIVYDTTTASFWYHTGLLWKEISTVSTTGTWGLNGNAGTDPSANFIGTTDDHSLLFKIRGLNSGIIDSAKNNTAFGYRSLQVNGNGAGNTGIGNKALLANTSGNSNTALGFSALTANTSGTNNTASGEGALASNITGDNNTANGQYSLLLNTTGDANTANGVYALLVNATGSDNAAMGYAALTSNTSGSSNTAVGESALAGNTTGNFNTAMGFEALNANTTGYSNIAIGAGALHSNSTDHNVVAIGDSALYHCNYTNPQGFPQSQNTAIGDRALFSETGEDIGQNTAVGFSAMENNLTGYGNTAVGIQALGSNTTGNSNIAIGAASLRNKSIGSDNIVIGAGAFFLANTATGNVAIGTRALNATHSSNFQTAVGNGALEFFDSQTGNAGNTAIGNAAMQTSNGFGTYNTALGDSSLFSDPGGIGNTAIGYHAAKNITAPGMSNCSFLGNNASFSFIYNAINIVNSTAIGANSAITNSNQVVLGDGNVTMVIPGSNGSASLGTAINKWNAVYATNGTIQTSDARLKTAIINTPYGLKTIMALRPVVYNWNASPDGKRMSGFIAQEVEKLVPEAVEAPKNDQEYYGMKYDALIPVLTKAIQEQQATIDALTKKSDIQQQQIDELKKIIQK